MSFAQPNAQALTESLKAYFDDPVLFCRQILAEWFPEAMPWFHRGMLAILLRKADFLLNFGEEEWAEGRHRYTKKDFSKIVRHFVYKTDPSDPNSPEERIFRVQYDESGRRAIAVDMVLGKNVLEIIPRGYAKTTIIKAAIIFKTVFSLTRFWVYISETEGHAAGQLDHIKRELETNERILTFFGNLKPERSDNEKWTSTEIETLTGIKGIARGRGQQIRGMNRGGDRPDMIVIDDAEDEESVKTEDQREKTLTWVVQSVMPALTRFPQYDPALYMIGTLLHPEATLPTLAKGRDFTSIVLGGIDRDGEALWDSGHGLSLEALARKRVFYASIGRLFEFGLEFLSEVRDQSSTKFKKAWIKYQELVRADFVSVAIAMDPAISQKKRADMTAIAVTGVTDKGRKHILECWLKRGATPQEQIDEFFRLSVKWDCTRHGVEAVAYQAALVHMLRDQMFQKAREYGAKAYFQIDEIYPGKNKKEERVEGILQPLYASGYLTHQRMFPDLESQLLDWPRGLMDGPDAVAMSIALLEPYSALSLEHTEDGKSPLLEDISMETLEWDGGAP